MHYKRNSKDKLGCGLKHPWNITYSIPICCAFSLLLLGVACINPISNNESVYAEEGVEAYANGDDISLSISGDLSAAVQASTDKPTFRSHTVTASASNIESYSLSIKYDTGSTSLKNSTTGATVIKDLSTNTIGSSIPDNTWGWGWSDNTSTADNAITYQGMSITDKVIKSSTSPAGNAVSLSGKLSFGAKFAEGATAGHYQANVLVSFAIKPKEVTAFGGITNMQQMTTTICNAAVENETARLTDVRDNKQYWVTKLKDGNCWMTQNLDLDLTTSGLLSSNTDITTNWTSSSSMAPVATTTTANFTYKGSTAYVTSYNPGNIVRDAKVNSSISQNVDGYVASSDASYTGLFDAVTKIYNAHDLVGNVYSWYAATAGGQTNASICPKNWQLPASSGNKSYDALLDAYSMTSGNYYAGANLSPLYLLAEGVYAGAGAVNVGSLAEYWNQTTSVTYKVSSGPTTSTYPGEQVPGNYGRSVRCVAR